MSDSDGPSPLKTHAGHIYLVDGYGFVFRAFHSLPPLTRPDGLPVGAIYGFTNMLLKLSTRARSEGACSLLVVLDAGKQTFRHQMHAEYKANRPPPPEELKVQFPLVREAAEALALPVAQTEGVEADDVIASYALAARNAGFKVTIVSSDKDLMQLVGDDVEMLDPLKNKRITPKEVEEKFGVPPSLMLDLLALMGDSADNIPGVPGIGPKTAAELLRQHGGLEAILAHAPAITQKKRRENLIAYAEQARLSKQLAALKYDVELPHPLDALKWQSPSQEVLQSFLHVQGFTSLLKKLPSRDAGPVAQAPSVQASSMQDSDTASSAAHVVLPKSTALIGADALQNFLAEAPWHCAVALWPIIQPASKKASIGSACWEAFGIALGNAEGDIVASASVTWDEVDSVGATDDMAGGGVQGQLFEEAAEDKALDHGGALSSQAPLPQKVLYVLQQHLVQPHLQWVGYHSKAWLDVVWDEKVRAHPTEAPEDVALLAWLVEGSQAKATLPSLMQRYLGIAPSAEEDGVTPDQAAAFAAALLPLHTALQKELHRTRLHTVYDRLERPLIPVLRQMEQSGVTVNQTFLQSLSNDFATRMAALHTQITQEAGEEFNLASPKQLGHILFEKMGLKGGKKTKSGAYSTDAKILEQLADEGHAIAEHLLKWRGLAKLKNTYTDALVALAHPTTSRVHTTFAMTATATGRLSSLDPNLQNIPVRTEEGRRIREAFCAQKGCQLIGADYSQIELRLLAHVANIEALKQAFAKGRDIHTHTAAQVFGLEEESVSATQRYQAKAVNFGIIYGQSAFGLARQLGIGRGEASDIIAAYFKEYPGIADYMEAMKEKAHENGFVTTISGRRCFLPEIRSSNKARQQFAERAAINAPLQGSAADIIKRAMVHLHTRLQRDYPEARLLLQVHDELMVEAPKEQAEAVAVCMKQVMEAAWVLDVPLVADAAIGTRWSEIH